ncbi:MAG: hypothetical protein ACE5GW_08970 [Planctomycetota bacterium]
MSPYQKMVHEEAQRFFEECYPIFEKDEKEFGGASDESNLPKWLDRTRKLFDRVDEISKGWSRSDAMMIQQNSRNSVSYGDPKESAYFAFYKDVVKEMKKLRKTGAG